MALRFSNKLARNHTAALEDYGADFDHLQKLLVKATSPKLDPELYRYRLKTVVSSTEGLSDNELRTRLAQSELTAQEFRDINSGNYVYGLGGFSTLPFTLSVLSVVFGELFALQSSLPNDSPTWYTVHDLLNYLVLAEGTMLRKIQDTLTSEEESEDDPLAVKDFVAAALNLLYKFEMDNKALEDVQRELN